ncbi:hypothetical protein Tco_0786870 [Tanacetum coccineum]
MALLETQIQKQCYNKHTAPTTLNRRQDYLPSNDMVRQGGIRLERADTGKKVAIADATCYDCRKQGHYSRNYASGKVRDKSYFRVKMLLAAKEENGQALTMNENDFYVETDDEGEQLELNVVFMARLEKILDPTCDNSKVHHELVDPDYSTMLQSYALLQAKKYKNVCLEKKIHDMLYKEKFERPVEN